MRILLIASFFFFSNGVFGSPLDCALRGAKFKLVENTSILNPQASFAEISASFASLRRIQPQPSLSLDARRLVNEQDWDKAVQSGLTMPSLTYGEITLRDWSRALEFVNQLPKDIPLSSSLLKEIHLRAAENLKFHGFEGRRVALQKENGNLTPEEAREKFAQVYKGNQEAHGVSHDDLRGVFRSSSYDEIIHRGSSFDDQGSRYFTREEKEAMIRNKFIQAKESDFTVDALGRFRGTVRFNQTTDIEPKVNRILLETDLRLKENSTLERKVAVIMEMKRDLMSIHPFLDGNGRTIRLLEDHLLMRIGLPPALFPNENDLLMTIPQSVEFARKHMIRYTNEVRKEALVSARELED